MGCSKILSISSDAGHVKTAIHYAVRDDKAMLDLEIPLPDGGVEHEKIKLASTQHVTCLEWAAEEFALTRARFGKESGRLAYQIIQSFSPDEPYLTPEKVHEIGVELARKLFGDHEAVIGTHVDRDHLHNHIIINAVSCRDGRKIHLTNGWIENTLWPESDRISKAHGARLTPERKQKSILAPIRERFFKDNPFKETIRRDMLYAIRFSSSRSQILARLESYGYKVDRGGRHIKVQPPGASRFFRIDRIYPEHEYAPIHKMPFGSPVWPHKLRPADKNSIPEGPNASSWQLSFALYVRMLGEQTRSRREDISFSEYMELPKRLDQLRYVMRHDIRSPRQVKEALADIKTRLKETRRDGRRIAREKKRLRPLVEAADTAEVLSAGSSLLPHQRETLAAARQTIQSSGMTPGDIRTAQTAIEAQGTANTRLRKTLFAEMSMLRDLKRILPRIRSAVQTRLKELLQRGSQSVHRVPLSKEPEAGNKTVSNRTSETSGLPPVRSKTGRAETPGKTAVKTYPSTQRERRRSTQNEQRR